MPILRCARSRIISQYFKSGCISSGNFSVYMAINLRKADVHVSIDNIFLGLDLGTRLKVIRLQRSGIDTIKYHT